jgi:hypothetical protein
MNWNTYDYTMIFTRHGETTEETLNSDSMMFLIQLGSAGLETGMYDSATIYYNKGLV